MSPKKFKTLKSQLSCPKLSKDTNFSTRIDVIAENSSGPLVVVELEAHAVMDFIVLEGDVVLVDVVPLLDPNLVGSGTRLSSHELLEVAYGVILVALHLHLLPETIVQHHLNHLQYNQQSIRQPKTLIRQLRD